MNNKKNKHEEKQIPHAWFHTKYCICLPKKKKYKILYINRAAILLLIYCIQWPFWISKVVCLHNISISFYLPLEKILNQTKIVYKNLSHFLHFALSNTMLYNLSQRDQKHHGHDLGLRRSMNQEIICLFDIFLLPF